MNQLKQYVPLVLFLSLIVLSFLLVKPLLISISLGAILAFILRPLYLYFSKKINKTVSAFLICIIVLIIILVPGVFLIKSLISESYLIFISVKQKLAVGVFQGCENNFCNWIESFSQKPEFGNQVKDITKLVTNWIIEKGSSILISLPKAILHLFVVFFTMFYFLKDGSKFEEKFHELVGMKDKRYHHVLSRLKKILSGVIFGNILVALIQGAFGALGFFIFGIPSPLFWGLIMAFCALIPIIGTGFIWLPASLFLILDGVFQDSNWLIFKGIALLIYSAIFVGSSDNLLKPKLMAGRASVHPVIILLGIIGGIAMFGIVGVLIGPLILSLTTVLIESYFGAKD
ncbi:MAG: AI-2E family transporter [archaeon]